MTSRYDSTFKNYQDWTFSTNFGKPETIDKLAYIPVVGTVTGLAKLSILGLMNYYARRGKDWPSTGYRAGVLVRTLTEMVGLGFVCAIADAIIARKANKT